MDNEKVPVWAKREFCNRAGLDYQQTFSSSFAVALQAAVKAGGRLIAEHEDPPVDPLLVEARALLADWPSGVGFEDFTLKALRRGMELARKEDSHAG